MTNQVPVTLLQQREYDAPERWNRWRARHPRTPINLRKAHLLAAFLQYADLHGAILDDAFLRGAHLYGANLRGATLRNATLVGANLNKADLTGADLTGARLASCSMNEGTILQDAVLNGCTVYGIAAWGLVGEPRRQSNLIITLDNEPKITVDNLEVAQFIYLLINNAKIRRVVDTLTSKTVLILGRFTSERKAVLDQLKTHIHQVHGLVPVLFDFTKPAQTTIETVTLLARMARLVIADLSDAKSVLQELQAIVPTSPAIVVQPIIAQGQREPPMIDFFKPFPWFRPTIKYRSMPELKRRLAAVLTERT